MPDDANLPAPQGQFLIYADGASQLQVRLEGNTVWLTQKLMAELYGVTVPTVNEHLARIYDEGELESAATIRKFRIVQREGTRDVSRNVEHYSLDAILTVGRTRKSFAVRLSRRCSASRRSSCTSSSFSRRRTIPRTCLTVPIRAQMSSALCIVEEACSIVVLPCQQSTCVTRNSTNSAMATRSSRDSSATFEEFTAKRLAACRSSGSSLGVTFESLRSACCGKSKNLAS